MNATSATRLYDHISSWISADFVGSDSLIQIGSIVLLTLVAWLIWKRLKPAYVEKTRRLAKTDQHLNRLIRAVRRSGWTLLMASMLLIPLAVTAQWHLEDNIITLCLHLTLAWALSQLVAALVGNRLLSHVTALTIWILAVLNILDLLDDVADVLNDVGMDIGDNYVSLLVVIKALVMLALFFSVSNFISRYTDRRIDSDREMSPSVKVLVSKGVKFSMFTLSIIFAAGTVGIDLTSLAVLGGAIGVGIGFGLQKVFSNLVSGLILLLDKSIKPGDTIEVGDVYGKITSLKGRYASVLTRDGKEYLIPNENLITSEVVNWTYDSSNVRLKIPVGISYESDVHLAMDLLEQAAKKVPRILSNPAPVSRLMGFGESSVDLEVRVWIADAMEGVTNIRSGVLLHAWDLFHEHGIQIPFAQRDLHLKSVDPVAAATLIGKDKE